MRATFAYSAPLRGEVVPPGDKSVSHRALMLAAMAKGSSKISRLASGADVRSTVACLRDLGFSVEVSGGDAAVKGNGWVPIGNTELDCGNSGTSMRLLTGALASAESSFKLRGDESLSRRPMDWVAEPLERMGASVSLAEGRFPPVDLVGASLHGIDYTAVVTSAQVKSAVLLAAIRADGITSFTEPRPTRDHTERMLSALGAKVEVSGNTVRVSGGAQLEPFDLDVPGDISSVAFHVAAACAVSGSEIAVREVGLNPTRMGFIDVIRRMGADLDVDISEGSPEPMGDLRVRSAPLKAIEVKGDDVPRAIDELPLIALLATQAEGTSVISEAPELRAKETDRIATIASGLSLLGANVTPTEDGLVIVGPTKLHGGVVDSHGDHRIAMMLAVAGMISDGPVTVDGWECVQISYPEFEADLARLVA